ncbi:MAG: SH3 domain-containing protein, partial [Bdellovibrionales bacterium]|nr:SH3 domain-containing protein [Bdellovibrionales bacterium]
LKDGKLYLSLMADGGIYVWEPLSSHDAQSEVARSPEEGGPRNWKVSGVVSGFGMREQASTSAPVVALLENGAVLDNLGCAQKENDIWCDVQPFGGGPRGYVSAQFLVPAISPDGSVARGPDDSALRAGEGKFDATGKVPCAFHAGQPMLQCDFGVARAGGGYATVVVKRPDGKPSRAIFFRMGKAIGADTSQADGAPEFSVTKEADLNRIQLGHERYEIPDAVVLGG